MGFMLFGRKERMACTNPEFYTDGEVALFFVQSLDLPCNEDEPKHNYDLDRDIYPAREESDSPEVVEPANTGCILERLGGPYVPHGHTPQHIHHY